MMVEKNQDIVESKVSLKTWKKIFSIMLESKKKFILMIVFAVILASLEVIMPLLNKYAISHFFENNDLTHVRMYFLTYAFVAIMFGLSVWGFIHHSGVIEAKVSYQIRKNAFAHLQKLSFSYLDKNQQGWLMSRLTSDVSKLSFILSWGLVDFVWAFLTMLFILIIVFIYHPILALIILASLPIMFYIAIYYRKKILKNHRKSRMYNSEATAKYSESFLGAKTSKSLVIEAQNLYEFEQVANDLSKYAIKASKLSALFSSIILIVAYVAVASIMSLGGYLLVYEIDLMGILVDISLLQLFLAYAVSFFDPIMSISRIISDFQSAQAAAERIVDLLEVDPEIKDGLQSYDASQIKGNIEFRDATFYYHSEHEMVLNHFNLNIKAGSKIALVGHTGSGKTTIVHLLGRFYELKKGDIFIDGISIKDYQLESLHKNIGYVLQTPQLFSTTIFQNIIYGKLHAHENEVYEVCKKIGIHEMIMGLKDGYQTYVGEDGSLLSLGQKQLIAFARALLSNPQILVLDEATASVDSQTEVLLTKAMKILFENRTVIMIAHRLSTITDANQIVMLDKGLIVESGNHEFLIQKKGVYYALYKSQFMNEKEKI